MANNQLQLTKGDWIVHNRHGLGQITGMETKELLGKRQDFYVVRTESVTYWLPCSESGTESIRPVANSEAFKEAIGVIAQAPKPLEENFHRRLINIHERIQESSLLTKAALIRDMYARNVEKDVHINERKIFDMLEDQFISEWVAACNIDREMAQTELRKALMKSSVDLKVKKNRF